MLIIFFFTNYALKITALRGRDIRIHTYTFYVCAHIYRYIPLHANNTLCTIFSFAQTTF